MKRQSVLALLALALSSFTMPAHAQLSSGRCAAKVYREGQRDERSKDSTSEFRVSRRVNDNPDPQLMTVAFKSQFAGSEGTGIPNFNRIQVYYAPSTNQWPVFEWAPCPAAYGSVPSDTSCARIRWIDTKNSVGGPYWCPDAVKDLAAVKDCQGTPYIWRVQRITEGGKLAYRITTISEFAKDQRLWVAYDPHAHNTRGLVLTGCLYCNKPVNTYFNVEPIVRSGLTDADRACTW